MLKLMAVPVVAASMTVSIYVRTSDYPPEDAIRHLVAMGSCDAAFAVGLAPARRGNLGYHARNDPDGDGLACEHLVVRPQDGSQVAYRGGAKFVRP